MSEDGNNQDDKVVAKCFILHPWGKWKPVDYDTVGQGRGWMIRQKRVCTHCGKTQIQSQTVIN